jgi:sulfite reductase (NADPH) flavoprotein alpha-component
MNSAGLGKDTKEMGFLELVYPANKMTEVAYIPASAPFSVEQRAWLNGFLAGLLCTTPQASAPAAPSRPLLILYGSQTGSAERLAKALGQQSLQHGFAARVLEANAFGTVDLKAETHLLFVTSTWGEGDPPDNAASFWAHLNSAEAPDLKHLSFSVLALGDKNYSDFCGAGKKFDERFEKLGARRMLPRVDCDLDYETPAKAWAEAVFARLVESPTANSPGAISDPSRTTGSLDSMATDPVNTSSSSNRPFSRSNPFPARMIVNRNLNGEGSAKETRHVALSLEGSGLAYEVGDALGVLPTNCPALVSDVLSALGCDGEEGVKTPGGEETSLRNALLRHYQITLPAPMLVEAVAERAQSTELKSLLAPGNQSALEKHLHGREVIDLLTAHPLARFAPDEFVALLRKLAPRLYSIASSPAAHPGEVHLCVAAVRYETHGRSRKGVCSTFLADRIEPQTPVPVFVQASPGFRLPASGDTPVIMVGPGTGVAPFRAFLEQRRATGAMGKNWMFFGDQKRATDFLYREELEVMFTGGVLTRLDLAFSRDQQEKVYVQHRMVEHAGELFGWLEEGAHFFVCGDAKRMAKDVDAALHEVIQRGGGRTAEQAMEYVARLKQEKRYKRDVY